MDAYMAVPHLTRAYTSACSQSILSEPLSPRDWVIKKFSVLGSYGVHMTLLSRSLKSSKIDEAGCKEHSNMKRNALGTVTGT